MRLSPISGLPTEKTFTIDFRSEQDNRTYSGIFVVKRPTILDQAIIEAEKSKILGGRYYDSEHPGLGVPEFASQIAEAVAYLRVVCLSTPEWFNAGNLTDAELLFKIYEEARRIDPFRGNAPAEKANVDGKDGGDSNQKHIGTNAANLLADMVDEEVQNPGNEQRMERPSTGRSNR